MLDNIVIKLKVDCKLRAEDLLLVGVSGGSDSLCLLHILHQIGYPVIAVHVNHRLRPESDDEEQAVKQFALRSGVDFLSSCVDVNTYARDNSISIEEAARILRYSSLFAHAKILKAGAVVVGHNADDQVETILMHLLRGSGLAGLCGMEYRTVPNPWSDDIPLVRPFLSTWRADVQKYINVNKLIPVTDRSNFETKYFRNRIRHELLPILDEYNPCIRDVLFRMAQSIKGDYAVLQQLAAEAWKSTLIQHGDGFLTFQRSDFLELPISIQRYLLRMAIAYHLLGLRDVGFDCIERGLTFLSEGKSTSQIDLIAGIRLVKEGKQFWIATGHANLLGGDFPIITCGERKLLLIPSTLILNDGWELHVEECTDPDLAKLHGQSNLDPFQAWMDINGLDLPMIARPRKPGDQISPLGLGGHSTKISDLMINLKIPNRARATWPLVCSGEDILWVPGYRLSELVRVKQDSRKIVYMTLRQRRSS